MATYKLAIRDVTGRTMRFETCGQPDDINEYLSKLTLTGYQSFIDDIGNAVLINMHNIIDIEITKGE